MKLRVIVKNFSERIQYSSPWNGREREDGSTAPVYYMNLRFAKCTPPEKTCLINADYCFGTSFARRDGTSAPEIVIMSYSVIEENKPDCGDEKTNEKSKPTKDTKEDDEDLPF